MSRTVKFLVGILVGLLVIGLLGIAVVYMLTNSNDVAEAPTSAEFSVGEACKTLEMAGYKVDYVDTTGACQVIVETKTLTVPVEVIREVEVTKPCTDTVAVEPTPAPTAPPAAPAPAPVCKYENGWSKQDDMPADGGVYGSADSWTYMQLWQPALGVASTVHVALAPGLELHFADSTLWAGTLYFTCNKEVTRWNEMVIEVQQRDALPAGLPALFVIEGPQSMNAAGYEVVAFSGTGAVPADMSPLAMDQFEVAPGADSPMGDAALWQYVELWDGVNASSAFHMSIAPGYVVRVPAGWRGSEAKFESKNEAKWQEMLATANADGLNRVLVIVDDLADQSALPAGFVIQLFPN